MTFLALEWNKAMMNLIVPICCLKASVEIKLSYDALC